MQRTALIVLLAISTLLFAACAPITPIPPPATLPPQATAAPAQPTAAPAAPTTAPTQAPAATKAASVLKLTGPGGTKTLTLEDVQALPATQGWAGIKSSTGKITIPEQYKGVSIEALCKVVGGVSANMGINLAAKDGYAMTISYDQISTPGGFITYDPGTGDEIKYGDPLTAIIAYERGGKALPDDTDGPLKLVVVSAKNNQVVDGHWAVKWINEISVKEMALDWKLPMGGAIAEEMDRGTFQSCASPSCHGKTWTDGKANVYSGVPLWLMAGRVDDETKHGDNAYNEKLALQGYPVHVVSVDGTKIVLDSKRVNRNNNILVAYLMNNNPLDEKEGPLKLVGSELKPEEMTGRISKINLMLSAASAITPTNAPATPTTPKPTEAPKPTTAATAAPTGPAALTIAGAVAKPQSLTLGALQAMPAAQIKAEHPKQGMQNYQGVRLLALLDLAQVKDSVTKVVMSSSDNFSSEVSLADVKKCADCLLAFNGTKLDAVMPGMASNFWAKDVVKLEFR